MLIYSILQKLGLDLPAVMPSDAASRDSASSEWLFLVKSDGFLVLKSIICSGKHSMNIISKLRTCTNCLSRSPDIHQGPHDWRVTSVTSGPSYHFTMVYIKTGSWWIHKIGNVLVCNHQFSRIYVYVHVCIYTYIYIITLLLLLLLLLFYYYYCLFTIIIIIMIIITIIINTIVIIIITIMIIY